MQLPTLIFAHGCWHLTKQAFDYTLELCINSEGRIERKVHDEGHCLFVWTREELDDLEDRQPHDISVCNAQAAFFTSIMTHFDQLLRRWHALELLVDVEAMYHA